jgi:hypothetical protein
MRATSKYAQRTQLRKLVHRRRGNKRITPDFFNRNHYAQINSAIFFVDRHVSLFVIGRGGVESALFKQRARNVTAEIYRHDELRCIYRQKYCYSAFIKVQASV